MSLKKYKYYFAKPKSEITKDFLNWLLITGAVAIAATSPYFARNLLNAHKRWKKYPRKKVYDTFYHLKRGGFISIEKSNHQIYISLTDLGRKKAGIFQINNLKIKKPKKWDGLWRIVVFDIPDLKRTYREALRGKLRELNFYRLQKSVWVYPFDCQAEIDLLRDFFGLSKEALRLIISSDIGGDDNLKKTFKLN